MLTDDEGNPILYDEIDYYNPIYDRSELLTYLKPGDIVYEGNGQFLGDLFGHIAMVIGIVHDSVNNQDFVLMIEAYLEGVCYSVMTPERFLQKDVVIIRLNDVTDSQIQGAIDWAKGHLGDKWNILEIISGKEYDEEKEIWYCSEFIWAAYYSQGVYIDVDDNLPQGGSIVYPDEILMIPDAITVMHHEYTPNREIYDDIYHSYSYGENIYLEEHDYVYESINNQTHSVSCFCGYTSTEAHDYETYNFCYEKCSDCGNVRQAKEHSYTYRYEKIDTISHYSYCECGKQRNDLHNFKLVGMMNVCENCNCRVNAEHVHSYTYTPRNDGKNHIKECSCGIFVMEQCLGEMSLGGQSLCSKCGQVVRSGIGILSDEDDDALPFNKEDDDYLE